MSDAPFEEFDINRITELSPEVLRSVTNWCCECDWSTAAVLECYKELLRRSENDVAILKSMLPERSDGKTYEERLKELTEDILKVGNV